MYFVDFALFLRQANTQSYHLLINFRQTLEVTSVFCEVVNMDHVFLFNEGFCTFQPDWEWQAGLDVISRLQDGAVNMYSTKLTFSSRTSATTYSSENTSNFSSNSF